VIADVPFTSFVVWGVESDTHIDVGVQRTFSDLLMMRGEVNVHMLAASLRVLYRYLNGYMRSSNVETMPSNGQLLELLVQYPEIRLSITAVSHDVWRLMPRSTAIGLHYIFSLKHGQEAANKFFSKLASGSELIEDDPVFHLRRTLLRDLSEKRKLPTMMKLALTIKAWNSWIEGRPLRLLKFNAVGPQAEEFPEIL